VIEGGGGFGFEDKPPLSFGVAKFVGAEELDGDKAVEVLVTRFVNRAHAALAELLDDGVVSDLSAQHK
jgi:hypothetical protein